jgi:hypothetical protein
MWETRNQAVHGKDSESRQKARIRRATIELRHLHKKRNTVLATDRDLFLGENDNDLTQWIQTHSATHIENWLRVWKPVLVDSVKAAPAFALQSVRPLREYFQTTRNPPSPVAHRSPDTLPMHTLATIATESVRNKPYTPQLETTVFWHSSLAGKSQFQSQTPRSNRT